MFIRKKCPVCEDEKGKCIIRMGKEYLCSGESGWKHPSLLMELAGFTFEENQNNSCSYYECSSCGTYYIKEVMPMEEAFHDYYINHASDSREEGGFKKGEIRQIESFMERADQSIKMVRLAIEGSKDKDDFKVLDYGCGGGRDLSILKSFHISPVVGYNILERDFDLTRKYMQNDIILVNNKEDLEKHAPFDAIRCNQVLEHVYDPNSVVEHIKSLLKTDGIVFFSAPYVNEKLMIKYKKLVENNIRVKMLHPGHLQIWNKDSFPFSKFIESHGFRIIPLPKDIRIHDVTSSNGFLRYGEGLTRHIIKLLLELILLKTNFRKHLLNDFYAMKIK